MNLLIQRNKSGDLAPVGGREKGFLIEGKRVGGLYTFMRKRLDMGSDKFRKKRSSDRNRAFALKIPPNFRIVATSRTRGSAIHRRVQHALFCKEGAVVTPCRCRFAKKASPAETQYVRAARQFADQHSLRPLAAELVVPAENMATQVDALFRDRNNDVVLVSWKTGTPPAEDSVQLLAHKTQLASEWALLQHYNGVSLSVAYVVYLTSLYNKTENKRTCAFSVCTLERIEAMQVWNDANQKVNSKRSSQ